MNLNALKHAVELTKVKREVFRAPSLSRLREAVRIAGRTIQDDKQIYRLQKQLDSEIAAHKAALEELVALKAQLSLMLRSAASIGSCLLIIDYPGCAKRWSCAAACGGTIRPAAAARRCALRHHRLARFAGRRQ